MPKTLSETARDFQTSKARLSNYLKRASSFGLDSSNTDTQAHLRCNIARDLVFSDVMRRNAVLLQANISLSEILPKTNKESITHDTLSDIACGRFDKDYTGRYIHSDEYLDMNIQEYHAQGKIIFIMFILEDYCVVSASKGNVYSTHSTCMVLVPNRKTYNAYYINSHGRDMSDTATYRRVASRRRVNTVNFKDPAELMFIDSLISYWNTLQDSSTQGISITWNMSSRHTYLGGDLQAGDYEGRCFAFPQVIWHYLGEYYSKTRTFRKSWGTVKIDTCKKLLNNGCLSMVVKAAFIDFNESYCNTLLTCSMDSNKSIARRGLKKSYSDDLLEKEIEKSGASFVKGIVCSLVRYIDQAAFKI